MRALLVAVLLLSASPLAAQEYQPPGYGVVESVTRIPAASGEESASAGASAPASPARKPAGRYLVRVRMDDGSIQVRTVKQPEVKPGQRALVTNAGDVIPE
jgi:hypothetical protein